MAEREDKRSKTRARRVRSGAAVEYNVVQRRAIEYRSIAASSPSEKSNMVREGLSTAFVKQMANDLAIDQSVLTDSMGIARSTFTRKARKHEALSSGESAVALGLARIIGEIERVLAESGDPAQMATFDVTEWVGTWLREPVPALGGRPPLEFMDNPFGQETVLQLVGQMQSGAFA
jgi:putative toxin-antitoxin system antitoxin component (TIGR02293 family)